MARPVLRLLALAVAATPAAAADPPGFGAAVEPFLRAHCLRCHDAGKAKGDFRLDTLSRDLTDPQAADRWAEVVTRVTAGEMPPADQPRPSADDLARAVDAVTAGLRAGEAARLARRGPVAHYRLSRDEYAHTVYDLLGVRYDPTLPGGLLDDPRWHGFDRIGSALTLSPAHVDRYLRAADVVLQRAFPESPAEPLALRKDAVDIGHHGRRKWLEEMGLADKVRVPVWPAHQVAALRSWWAPHLAAGVYRCRVTLSGLAGLDGRAPHLAVWDAALKRSVFDEDVVAPEDKPVTVEFEAFVDGPADLDLKNEVPAAFAQVGNHTLNVLAMGGSVYTTSTDDRFVNPTGYKLFTDDGRAVFPLLLIDRVEWDGPVVTPDERAKRAGLLPAALAPRSKIDDLLDRPAGPAAPDWAEARDKLARFATRAWRRPVAPAEVDRYVNVARAEVAAGEPYRSAYLTAMAGVLASQNFYYLTEGAAGEDRDRLTDWELAARLSYFLWGSMPDDRLVEAAQYGLLSAPDGLRRQVRRMSADPKVGRFTDAFPRQWLQLHKVGAFPPDPGLYPDYDKWLEQSMVREATGFFARVFADDLSVGEFLASDWTVANPRLARFYGLPPLPASGFQRVSVRPADHRGGLLTQAAVLMLTSDGTRHRPVHRGVWVSEAIFGKTPPPPPPNVDPLPPTPLDKPKATVREQLQAHATHATCAACHRHIDPLGFAFDNYDAIGRWRTTERTPGKGADPPVNAAGVLPDGRAFAGPDEFKRLLAADLDRFAEAFVGQLATFALRRAMTADDAPALRQIARASKADGYKLRAVVEHLVTSDLFRRR